MNPAISMTTTAWHKPYPKPDESNDKDSGLSFGIFQCQFFGAFAKKKQQQPLLLLLLLIIIIIIIIITIV